jgi:hypothetical protein
MLTGSKESGYDADYMPRASENRDPSEDVAHTHHTYSNRH